MTEQEGLGDETEGEEEDLMVGGSTFEHPQRLFKGSDATLTLKTIFIVI